MNVRFQVFVSSTQRDLKDERERIINELNRIGYIAVGMEQFPATDEEQFEYIQRIIDDSDYYVVIVKGRYGSEDAEGKSYTEKEFDYAVSTKKPALAFLYATPEKLRLEETDNSPEKMRKLQAFRDKLEAKRIVHYWREPAELVSSIKDSVNDIARRRPGIGWVRGDQAADPSVYKELDSLRKHNAELREQVSSIQEEVYFPPHLAQGDDEFELELAIEREDKGLPYTTSTTQELHRTKIPLTWNTIYQLITPIIYDSPKEIDVKAHMERVIATRLKLPSDQRAKIIGPAISTAGYQFEALDLIRIHSTRSNFGSSIRNWEITERGRRFVAHLRAIKREKN